MCLLSVNTITPEPLEISSRNFHDIILCLMVERADKFKNGYRGLQGYAWYTSYIVYFDFIFLICRPIRLSTAVDDGE